MSEFTHHQKTIIVQSLLILLEAEPADLLEEVLALISYNDGTPTDEQPIWIHDMFLVRNNAIELITKFMADRGLSMTTTPKRIRNSTLFGQLTGKQGFSLEAGFTPDSFHQDKVGFSVSPLLAGLEINAKLGQDQVPIEQDFLLRAVVPGFRDGTIESEFDITQDVPKYLTTNMNPKPPGLINMEHGPTTFAIGDEIVDVMNLTEGQLGRLRQTGKYGFHRLVDAKMTSVLHAATGEVTKVFEQSSEQQIFNILYPMMKSASTMAVQGEIERFLFTDDQTLGNKGPLLSRAGIPRPTRTDAIEYMVHALATRLRTRVTIELYDLKWERQSAYCHCTREVPLSYNSQTRRWMVGPTKTFHDDPTLELTPDRAAMMILDMAGGEGSQYPYDHPFQEVPLPELLALASIDDHVGVLAWGQRTLSEPNSALVRHSTDAIARTFFKHSN